MGLVLEQIRTDGLAQLSYLVGDDAAGVAAVIDPRRDVDLYLDMVRDRDLRITHVIETHIHADFVSGVLELNARTGAEICGGDGDYGFSLRRLADGDGIDLGAVRLRAITTPGHTPEHICLALSDEAQGAGPFAVFTGDTLFNLDVGRPDLLGDGSERRLAGQLYDSLFDKILPLGDRVEIYPCHGAGSACGKAIGDRVASTLGNERRFNPALKDRSRDAFVTWVLDDMPTPPEHYSRLKKLNAAGAPLVGAAPVVPPLSPEDFAAGRDDGATVLDVRSMLAFGGAHVPGALNIAAGPAFPTWAGRMLDADRPVLLVGENPAGVSAAAAHLFRIGHDKVAGSLHSGMTAWQNAACPLARIGQWSVHELDRRRGENGLVILDVRDRGEWDKGRIPGARHIFVAELEDRLDELDRDHRIVTYCGTGYRASIAASILARADFARVINVPGSWKAWKAAGLPVES